MIDVIVLERKAASQGLLVLANHRSVSTFPLRDHTVAVHSPSTSRFPPRAFAFTGYRDAGLGAK